jgi:hypothetical protein
MLHDNAKSDSQLNWVDTQMLDYNNVVHADEHLANSLTDDLIKKASEIDLLDEDIG